MSKIKKLKKEEKKHDQNEYDLILYKLIKNYNISNVAKNEDLLIKKDKFLNHFNNALKKGSFLAVFFPCVLFLIISLISFSLVVFSRDNQNMGVVFKNQNLRIGLIFISVFFFFLTVALVIQNKILKIRVIRIKYRKKNRYINLDEKTYKKITDFIDQNYI